MKVIFGILLLIVLAEVSMLTESNSRIKKNRITSGNAVSNEDFPFVVRIVILKHGKDYRVRCGASIINKNWAVTAAHCFDRDIRFYIDTGRVIIRGNNTHYRNSNAHHIVYYVVHEGFFMGDSNLYDIALTKVDEPFGGLYEKPIFIAPANYKHRTNSTASILGWGYQDAAVRKKSYGLRITDVYIEDREKCRINYYFTRDHGYGVFGMSVSDETFCAWALNKGQCEGDNGGPVVQNGFLIGIISMHGECLTDYLPSVYTKISAFTDWIKTEIEKSETSKVKKLSAARSKKQLRIIGGDIVSIKEYPFVVGIVFLTKQGRYKRVRCGASIIQTHWVVTAAHCLDRDTRFYIDTGRALIRGNFSHIGDRHSKDHHIIYYVVHELYFMGDSNLYDIALIKVEEPFDGLYEKPINVAPRNYRYQARSTASILGWGYTDEVVEKPSRDLRIADIVLTDKDYCFLKYHQASYHLESLLHVSISKETFCAWAPKKGYCDGDNGGPVVQNGVLIGIISAHAECLSEYFPGVYPKISMFDEWIHNEILKGNELTDGRLIRNHVYEARHKKQ